MTKAPIPTEMSKGQSDNTNNATKSSIKQQLQTDLGRSVGVTTVTQLVWFTRLNVCLPIGKVVLQVSIVGHSHIEFRYVFSVNS